MNGRIYRIRVEGYLEQTWLEWFDGLSMVYQPNGETELAGRMRDQAALYGLLNQLGNLGLALVAVNREPAETNRAASAGAQCQ